MGILSKKTVGRFYIKYLETFHIKNIWQTLLSYIYCFPSFQPGP